LPRPFTNVSNISQQSRQALQHALDVAYESRSGRTPEEIRLDLMVTLSRLRLELSAGEIEGWALEISEGQRIQIRIKDSRFRREGSDRLGRWF